MSNEIPMAFQQPEGQVAIGMKTYNGNLCSLIGNRHEDVIMAILAVFLTIVGTIMMAMSQEAGAMAAQVRKGTIHTVLWPEPRSSPIISNPKHLAQEAFGRHFACRHSLAEKPRGRLFSWWVASTRFLG